LAVAVTRAVLAGAKEFVVRPPAMRGSRCGVRNARGCVGTGVRARHDAAPILDQIRAFGGDLMLLDGTSVIAAIAARLHADNTGAVDVSTLREPYRNRREEDARSRVGRATGVDSAGRDRLSDGGGTGLIGMWKAFQELRQSGWLRGPLPGCNTVQASGCAPVVHAFESAPSGARRGPIPRRCGWFARAFPAG